MAKSKHKKSKSTKKHKNPSKALQHAKASKPSSPRKSKFSHARGKISDFLKANTLLEMGKNGISILGGLLAPDLIYSNFPIVLTESKDANGVVEVDANRKPILIAGYLAHFISILGGFFVRRLFKSKYGDLAGTTITAKGIYGIINLLSKGKLEAKVGAAPSLSTKISSETAGLTGGLGQYLQQAKLPNLPSTAFNPFLKKELQGDTFGYENRVSGLAAQSPYKYV